MSIQEIQDQALRNQSELLMARTQVLQNLVQKFSERNDYLTSNSIPQINEPSSKTFDLPPQELVNQFFEAQRRYLLVKKRNDRLCQASKVLDSRILSVRKVLTKQYEETVAESLKELSPTAARFYQSIEKPRPKSFPRFVPELETITHQIEAIDYLNAGEKPCPPGKLPNIDAQISIEENSLRNVKNKAEKATELFSETLKKYLSESNLLGMSSERQKMSEAWSNFHKVYNESTEALNGMAVQYTKQYLENYEQENLKNRLEMLKESLENEKNVLEIELRERGIGDIETANLKEELQFKVLYLEYLTSVAGKALSKLSTEKEPLNPLEIMESNIIESEIRQSH